MDPTSEEMPSQIGHESQASPPEIENHGLFEGAEEGNQGKVQEALNDGADINGKRKTYGETALHLAARFAHLSVIELLLAKGADINVRDDDDWTPLMSACYGTNQQALPVVKHLLGQFKPRAIVRDDSLQDTTFIDSSDMGESITDQTTPQMTFYVNISGKDGSTALTMACWRSTAEIVHVLLRNQANVNAQEVEGDTPLILAVRYGDLKMVQDVLSFKPDIHKVRITGRSALHQAMRREKDDDRERIVDILLDIGLPAGQKDAFGFTPLHLASEGGHLTMVKKLLDKNRLDIKAQNDDKETPLHLASQNGHLDVVEYLLECEEIELNLQTKEHINAPDVSGFTALHLACLNNNFDVARQLVSRGAKSRVGRDSTQSAWYLIVQDIFRLQVMSKPIHPELREGLASDSGQFVHEPADIKFILSIADKEEKASATGLADSDEARRFLAQIMEINESEYEDYELIRLAMSSNPFDTSKIVDRLKDKVTNFNPKPISALQWATYHGRHDIVWWILKSSIPAELDVKAAEKIAESKRNQLSQGENVAEASVGNHKVEMQGTQDREKAEKGFKLTLDMLKDPPLVEGAHSVTYRRPITSDAPKEVLGAHWATIVDFYERDGRVDLLRRSDRVANVIYPTASSTDEDKGPEGIMNKARTDLEKISVDAAKEKKYERSDLRMRWIHLPANNMEWMEDLAKRIFTEKKASLSEWLSLNDLLQRSWHELPTETAPAKFMKPVCLKESAQNMPRVSEKEDQRRVERRTDVDNNRRASTTSEAKDPKDQQPTEPRKRTKESRADDEVIEGRAAGSGDPLLGSANAHVAEKYERVALYMPYITFGLCHRKPPHTSETVAGALPKESVEDVRDDNKSQRKNGKDIAIGKKPCGKADEPLGKDGEEPKRDEKDLEQDRKDREKVSEALQKYEILLKSYEKKTIHGTRSLDQFFYNSLPDMDVRDQNQVFTRSFLKSRNGDGVPKNRETWPYLAVDQLWLWVIDHETIITSSTHRNDDFHDPVVERLFVELRQAKMRRNGQPPPSTVKDMSRFIVTFCVDFLHSLKWQDFSQPDSKKSNPNDNVSSMSVQLMYQERINNAATEEKNLFHDFKTKMNETKSSFQKIRDAARTHEESVTQKSKDRTKSDKPPRKKAPESKNENNKRNWASISGAADLLDEVKDILDELTILKTLATRQLDVWKDLVGDDSGSKNARGPAYTLRGIKEMIEMADRVQQSVNDILSLEQNGINIDQAQESARQGTILMAFTIVTVVFTPLSFLTSLFALNVTSFQHNSSGEIEYDPGWIFPILFCASTAIIGLLMIYAFQGEKALRELRNVWKEEIVEKWKTHQEDRAQRKKSSNKDALEKSQRAADSPV